MTYLIPQIYGKMKGRIIQKLQRCMDMFTKNYLMSFSLLKCSLFGWYMYFLSRNRTGTRITFIGEYFKKSVSRKVFSLKVISPSYQIYVNMQLFRINIWINFCWLWLWFCHWRTKPKPILWSPKFDLCQRAGRNRRLYTYTM